MAEPNDKLDTSDKDDGTQENLETPAPPEPGQEFKTYGEYESWNAVGEALKNAQKKIGEQGTNVGDLRKRETQLSELLQQANLVIQGLTSERGREEKPKTLTTAQVKRVMEDFYTDPIGLIADVTGQVVSEKLKGIEDTLAEYGKTFRKQSVFKDMPELEKLSPELQDAVVKDKSGKIGEAIKTLISELAKVKGEKDDASETIKTLKSTPLSVLRPTPGTKLLSSEEEYDKEINDAIKNKDYVQASRLVSSRLGQK